MELNGKWLNNGQEDIYLKLKVSIETDIAALEENIKIVNKIKFTPKKDGTERSVFVTNFEFEGLPATRPGYKGPVRYVVIKFERDLSGNIYKVIIDTESVEGEFEYGTQSFYLRQFGVEDNRREIPAEEIYGLIKGPYLDYLERHLEEYRNELKIMPEYFLGKIIPLANKMQAEYEEAKQYSHIHTTMYDLLGHKFGYAADNK